jgi:hypothetical protein
MIKKILVVLLVVSIVFALAACGGPKVDQPAWVKPELSTVERTPVSLVGRWVVNEVLSDDPALLMQNLVKRSRHMQRPPSGGNSGGQQGRRLSTDDYARALERDPLGMNRILQDPRLPVLSAKTVEVRRQGEQGLAFVFDNKPAVMYPTDGRPVSDDNNINIALADWEGSQFVVEKNGPRGMILERWILSPDASQLYLSVSIEMPLMREPLVISRMFDAVAK